jgi:hypothetical protein
VSDDRDVLGLPRFAVEAPAPNWDAHDFSLLSTYTVGHTQFPLALRQGGARYRWARETTYGMIERSMTLDRISGQPV